MLKIPVIDRHIENYKDEECFMVVLGGSKVKTSLPYTTTVLSKDLWADLDVIVYQAKKAKEQGVNFIAIESGTNNKGVTPEMLMTVINKLSEVLPVILRSYTPTKALVNKAILSNTNVKGIICNNGELLGRVLTNVCITSERSAKK